MRSRGQRGELTFHITSYICVWPLVLVDELYDPQQVFLLELLQRLGNLLVVVLLRPLLSRESLLLRAVLIRGQRPRLAQPLLQRLGRVLESDGMCRLVVFLEEVQVVGDGGQLRLLRREALDGDLELAPSFVGAGKGRLEEGWFASVGCQSQRSGLAGYPHKVGGNRDKQGGLTLNGILKRRVQVVDDLGEDVGRSLVAILVQDMQPQAPFSNGELIHGRLVGAGGRQYSLPARGRQRREAAYTMCWSVTTLTFRCRWSARFLVNRIFVVFRLGAMAREGGSDACCARARTRETRCVARAETGGRFAGARARGKKRVERKRAAEQNRNATSRAAASRRRGAQIRSPELLTRTLGCRPAGSQAARDHHSRQ